MAKGHNPGIVPQRNIYTRTKQEAVQTALEADPQHAIGPILSAEVRYQRQPLAGPIPRSGLPAVQTDIAGGMGIAAHHFKAGRFILAHRRETHHE
jgi:hypothetical protein